nr:cohesin domain-containing protein [uncultured Methanolobus sp.]
MRGVYNIKHTTIIGIFLFILVFGCFNSSATYVTLKPSTQIVTTGDNFTVDVIIIPDTRVAGLQFDIEYDSSKIQVNNVSKGEFLDSSGAPSFISCGDIDNSTGILSHVYGVVLGPSSIIEPGSFASITMTAEEQAASTSTISLKNVIVSDPSGHPIDVFIANTTLTINEESSEPQDVFTDRYDSSEQDNSWWDGWNDLWQDDWRHFW